MYTVTGDFDLQLRVVARNASELQDVFDRIAQVPGVARTSSALALREHFQGRTLRSSRLRQTGKINRF